MRVRSTTLLSVRAALCLSVPLLVGLVTGHRHQATVFTLGALWAASQDGLDAWPVRGRRLMELAGAVLAGFSLGAAVAWWVPGTAGQVTVLSGAALLAGFLQASGLTSVGAYGLLGTIVGSGIITSRSDWWVPVLASLGALWVWGAAAVMERQSRHRVLRRCLADAFEALEVAITHLGAPDALHWRSQARTAIDVAQDAVGSRAPRRNLTEGIALRRCTLLALRSGELVSYLATGPLPAPSIPELGLLKDHLASSFATDAIEALSAAQGLGGTPTRPAAIERALRVPGVEEALRWAPRTIERHRPPLLERLRFGLLLLVAVAGATALADALRGSHSYWLPMSVAFILRPDLGPVVRRALARTVGTLVGVAIAAVVAALGNPPVALMALSVLMAALMPGAARRGHSWAVMTFTPIVFVFVAMAGNDQVLFIPRVVDTALAAGIVLALDLVVWTTAPSLRPASQLGRAHGAVDRYLATNAATPVVDRAVLRRAAFRAIAMAAATQEQAEAEPSVLHRSLPSAHRTVDRLLEEVDHHSASLLVDAP